MFEVICAACLRASRGNLLVVTILLCCITAFVSAWLDNVTTMLLMAPMTMSVFEAVGRDPVPLLMAQAMLSNIGGTATLIGDPPNIIIGITLDQYIGFIDFMNNLMPGVIASVPACIAVMVVLYPKDLRGGSYDSVRYDKVQMLGTEYNNNLPQFFLFGVSTSLSPGQIEGFDDIMVGVNKYKIKDWKLFWQGGENKETVLISHSLIIVASNSRIFLALLNQLL